MIHGSYAQPGLVFDGVLTGFIEATQTASTNFAQILPIQDLAKVSGHKDLKILLNTYYNITASEIAEKMRKNSQP